MLREDYLVNSNYVNAYIVKLGVSIQSQSTIELVCVCMYEGTRGKFDEGDVLDASFA